MDVSRTPIVDPSRGAWFARIFNSLLVLGCVAAFGYLWSFPSPHKRTTDEPLKYLCQMQAACIKYHRTRLECATAEDLNTCLQIKMRDDYDFVPACAKIRDPPVEIPNWCLAISPF